MTVIRVSAIRTYPAPGEPGVEHEAIRVGANGLEGDRRKKAAVSLVGDDAPSTRANLVLDVPTGAVEALEGAMVRVGEVLLAVDGTGTSCPGLYAAVGETGWVRVGDVVETL
ncbi:MAG TPA: hypothetical protein VFI44_07770 [Ornithinibacter sp.]|nr:hypothetical protein [Ornithinibacter sp.]